jgi:exonuclease SbcC
LPSNYDGDIWRGKRIQEYYGKVAGAEANNKNILAAQSAIDGLQERIETLKASAEADKQAKKNQYDRQRSDCREFISFLNQKIETAQSIDFKTKTAESDKAFDNELAVEIERLKTKYEQFKNQARENINTESAKVQESIVGFKNSIANKEQELTHIDELEIQSIKAVDERTVEQIKTADAEAGNSKKVIETMKEIPVEPLQKEADEVAAMQSFLRDFDFMQDIVKNKLAPKEAESKRLTANIEKARSLPVDLLKISKCPIDGIIIDDNGMIRIKSNADAATGTLIAGLSDGERRKFAIQIARTRAELGDLKIVCFDGFQDLNPEEQRKIFEEAHKDDYQWYFLKTTDGDLKIEIIDMED